MTRWRSRSPASAAGQPRRHPLARASAAECGLRDLTSSEKHIMISTIRRVPAIPEAEWAAARRREDDERSSFGVAAPARSSAAPSGRLPAGRLLRRALGFDELGTAVALALLVALIGDLPPRLPRADGAASTPCGTAAFVAIVAYGMVFLLAMTEFDLSVGGIYAVALVLAAKWMADGGHGPVGRGAPGDRRRHADGRLQRRAGQRLPDPGDHHHARARCRCSAGSSR